MADTFSLQLVAYNDVVEPGYYGWRFTINCKQTRNFLQNTSLIEWEIKQEPNGLNIVYFPEVDETTLNQGRTGIDVKMRGYNILGTDKNMRSDR